MSTHTFNGCLPPNVVKELGVVSEHPPAGRTGDYLLLGVAPQVLSQLKAALEGGLTI